MNLQKVKEDILSLRGSEVSVFGQMTTIPEEVSTDVVDIVDIIDALMPYDFKAYVEVDNEEIGEIEEIECTDVDDFLDRLDCSWGLVEVRHGNSYNWSANVSNHFDFQIFESDVETYYVLFKVHRFGDVRANYTEEALLEFNHIDEFYEVIASCEKVLHHNGKHAIISALSDAIEVYNEDGEYITTVYDIEDFYNL